LHRALESLRAGQPNPGLSRGDQRQILVAGELGRDNRAVAYAKAREQVLGDIRSFIVGRSRPKLAEVIQQASCLDEDGLRVRRLFGAGVEASLEYADRP